MEMKGVNITSPFNYYTEKGLDIIARGNAIHERAENFIKTSNTTKDVRSIYSNNIKKIVMDYFKNPKIDKFLKELIDMAKQAKLIPFEVLVIERGSSEEEPTAEIIKVDNKEVNIVIGTNPQAVGMKIAMGLGNEYADKVDNIDIIVRPFVTG